MSALPSEPIYLDHNATTRPSEKVVEAVARALREQWGNPSSASPAGKAAKAALEAARRKVAACVGAESPKEIIFTSGGTECNHWVIHSSVRVFEEWQAKQEDGTKRRKVLPRVVTTNVEHVATELPLSKLQKEGKIELVVIPVDKRTGAVSAEEVAEKATAENTCLVTIMAANNETGVMQPIAEIGAALEAVNAKKSAGSDFTTLFHTDAAQVLGKVKVDVGELKVDFLSIVGHKFYGPRTGALYHRRGRPLLPVFLGGGQERGLRAGTENVAAAAGLGAAAEEASDEVSRSEGFARQRRMRDRLLEQLKLLLPPGAVSDNFSHLDPSRVLPNTLSASFSGVSGRDFLGACTGVQASTQAACHTQQGGEQEDLESRCSPILLRSGVPAASAAGTLRLSVGRNTASAEVDAAAKLLGEAYAKIKK